MYLFVLLDAHLFCRTGNRKPIYNKETYNRCSIKKSNSIACNSQVSPTGFIYNVKWRDRLMVSCM